MAPAVAMDSTPPPTERNLFHYYDDTRMIVVDILCFDSPMTVPQQRRQQHRGGTGGGGAHGGGTLLSPDVEPVQYFLSPGPRSGLAASGPPPRHRGPRSRSRSAPAGASSPSAGGGSPLPADLSWHSDAFPRSGSATSARSRSAPGGERGGGDSLPSPWAQDHTSEGSPFLLDDDVDDIILEDVPDTDQEATAAVGLQDRAPGMTPPPAVAPLEAYSPFTIALIVSDDDARHEMTMYLERASGLVLELYLQRCVALFSNFCLLQAMVIGVTLEEASERFLMCVSRDLFLRQTISDFVSQTPQATRARAAAAVVAKTPPASQKSSGRNGGRRSQYLVEAAGGPPQAALPS